MPFKVISPSKYFILSFLLASPNRMARLLGKAYSPRVPQENINLNKRELNSQGPYSLVEKKHRRNFYQYGCAVTQTYTGGL